MVSMTACKEIAGATARSFVVGDQFVIVNRRYAWHNVTWVVVRNWPKSSRPQDRLDDRRLVLEFGAPHDRLIRLPSGKQVSPASEPHLYFFDGDNLTSFPIRMSEDDWIAPGFDRMTSYADILKWFRTFAVHPSRAAP